MAFSYFSRKSHFSVIMDKSFFKTIISASMYCKSLSFDAYDCSGYLESKII